MSVVYEIPPFSVHSKEKCAYHVILNMSCPEIAKIEKEKYICGESRENYPAAVRSLFIMRFGVSAVNVYCLPAHWHLNKVCFRHTHTHGSNPYECWRYCSASNGETWAYICKTFKPIDYFERGKIQQSYTHTRSTAKWWSVS